MARILNFDKENQDNQLIYVGIVALISSRFFCVCSFAIVAVKQTAATTAGRQLK